MCYHKSIKTEYEALVEHYRASFESIQTELEPVKDRLLTLMGKDDQLSARSLTDAEKIGGQLIAYSQKDALPDVYSKQELSEMKWCLKTLTGFDSQGVRRFHENGFDYLPSPIITAGTPGQFKLFKWGLIPHYMTDGEKAMLFRPQTLNCISEEMYDKPSFRDAAKNAQRCLIPVKGFFEWRWLDEQGTIKIPYYVTFRDQGIRSMAGLYSRWKDKRTGEYYYSYTVLTTAANAILEYVHNNKKRMPVFIARENEKDWLNKDLSKDDVLDLCRPFQDPAMRAYTISKLLTTKNINTNVPEVIAPMNYNDAVQQAAKYLQHGDKKTALELFKNVVSTSASDDKKIKIEDLQNAAGQEIRAELAAG